MGSNLSCKGKYKSFDRHSFVESFTSFTTQIGGIYPILLIDNMKIAARYISYRKQQSKLTTLFRSLPF
jgi:hypothetical protein